MSAHPQPALPAGAPPGPAMLPGVWRGDQLAAPLRRTRPTGFMALDAELPGGGWPVGALVDLLLPAPGVGEVALLAPALAHATREGRDVLWVAPPLQPCAPALQQAGLLLPRLTLVMPAQEADAWWAAEQALKSGACAFVLLWCPAPARTGRRRIDQPQALRRLHLAAQAVDATVITLQAEAACPAGQASPAPLRLACRPLPGRGLAVQILKRQGPACDQPLRLVLPDAPEPGLPCPQPTPDLATGLDAQPLPSALLLPTRIHHAVDLAAPAAAAVGSPAALA